jgi:hypothetical protein
MDLQERFPLGEELELVAKVEEAAPARLLLRAVRQQRDKYVKEILAGIETLPENKLRSMGGKAAALTEVLDAVEQAKQWVRQSEPEGEEQ